MASAQKRRKIEHEGNVSTTPVVTDKVQTHIPTWHNGRQDFKIQEAKIFAMAQAQREGCLGSYRSFDSPFGNYLLPVIPSHAELFSGEDCIQTVKPGEAIGGMKQTKTFAAAQMTQ